MDCRVLYLDAAGEGRFEDVRGVSSMEAAAFAVAIALDTNAASFVEMRAIDGRNS